MTKIVTEMVAFIFVTGAEEPLEFMTVSPAHVVVYLPDAHKKKHRKMKFLMWDESAMNLLRSNLTRGMVSGS